MPAIGSDRAGDLLEVIWLEFEHPPAVIIHAMALRAAFYDLLPKATTTPAGRDLTDSDLDAIADEVDRKVYDVGRIKARRRGRPSIGSGPAEVVPVRLDPELRAAIEARAAADQVTTSEVIREALRRFLDVA